MNMITVLPMMRYNAMKCNAYNFWKKKQPVKENIILICTYNYNVETMVAA